MASEEDRVEVLCHFCEVRSQMEFSVSEMQ
jgi:hypothetical protein